MKLGDKVVGTEGRKLLFCGSGIYPYAIVTSLEPFRMVSEGGDMLWTQQDPKEFEVIGRVSLWKVLMLRLRRSA